MAVERGTSFVGQAGQFVASTVGRAAAAPAPGAFSDVDRTRPDATPGQYAQTPVDGDPTRTPNAEPAGQSGGASASFGAVLVSFVLIAGAGVGSWALWSSGGGGEVIRPPDTVAVFGILIVFAAAIERILEPFSRWLPGRRVEADVRRTEAELANLSREASPAERAALIALRERADRGKGNRTIVAWGIAVAVATLASTAGGFYLLHAIAGPEWKGLPVWIDGIVTGIMVGSGTKPMHDLISRLQPGGAGTHP